MAILRHKQRAITARFPHQGNKRYIIPKRIKSNPNLVKNGNFALRGPELVLNGGFDTDANWDFSANGWFWETQQAKRTDVAAETTLYNDGQSVLGKLYEVGFVLVSIAGGGTRLDIGGPTSNALTSPGTLLETVTGGSGPIGVRGGSAFAGTVDNVHCRQVGEYWDWSADGWFWDADTAKCDGSQAAPSDLVQTVGPGAEGKKFEITFTLDVVSAGGVQVMAGATAGTLRTTPGTYVETLTMGAGDFALRANAAFVGEVTSVSAVEVET